MTSHLSESSGPSVVRGGRAALNEVMRLRGENERLREALERIAGLTAAADMSNEARRALATADGPPDA